MSPEELQALEAALRSMGCPPDRCGEMASQLDRRAAQLAEEKGKSHQEALVHLLGLMARGWAAQAASGHAPDPGN